MRQALPWRFFQNSCVYGLVLCIMTEKNAFLIELLYQTIKKHHSLPFIDKNLF